MADIRFYLLELVNNFRKDHGLQELHLDHELSGHAKAHSEHRVDRFDQLWKNRHYAHTEPHLRGNWNEIVAWGESHKMTDANQLAEKMFNGWLKSPGHRQAILNAKTHVGIDIAHREHSDHRRMFMTGRFR